MGGIEAVLAAQAAKAQEKAPATAADAPNSPTISITSSPKVKKRKATASPDPIVDLGFPRHSKHAGEGDASRPAAPLRTESVRSVGFPSSSTSALGADNVRSVHGKSLGNVVG